jgi:hypothetical protein
MRNFTLGLALLFLMAAPVRADSNDDRAGVLGPQIDDQSSQVLDTLSQLSDTDRFLTMRALDRGNDTTVRRLYDHLDDAGKAKLLDLCKKSGDAAKAAGLLQTGLISDVDDTAIPTDYTPDGVWKFEGAPEFYRLVSRGTDGAGDPANLHFVSARLPIFYGNTKERLEAAGMPIGTMDGDADPVRFATGGLDGIQTSKIENLDLWLKLHPNQRFVFMGDTLQRDPEVYEWVVKNHPEAVEAVLIHKAGGPARDPAAFKGETFFDTYADATRIVTDRGIPQLGARLPDHSDDPNTLPLPSTDVSNIKKPGFLTKVWNFMKENVGSLFHHEKAPVAAKAETPKPSVTEGMTNILQDRVQEATKAGEGRDK